MLRQKYEYHFDEDGRIIKKVMRGANDGEIFRDAYTYDPQSNINEARLSMAGNPVGQILSYENTIDAQGNWIKRQVQNTIIKSGEKRTEVIYRKISYRKDK